MKEWIAQLIGALGQAAGSLAGRVMLALGFQTVTFKGLDTVIGGALKSGTTALSGLGSDVLQIVGLLRVDEAIAIVAAAVVARIGLSSLASGMLTRWVMK